MTAALYDLGLRIRQEPLRWFEVLAELQQFIDAMAPGDYPPKAEEPAV